MSRNMAQRNYHFSATSAPPPAAPPRRSRASLAIEAIRNQDAAVEFDGAVALYTAMRPSERRLTERAITDKLYTVRRLPSGLPVYVVQPPAAKPKRQRNRHDDLAAARALKQLAAGQ